MNYRIKKSLAARLRTVLVKNDSTMNYIGCNIQYLREWFEYNFTSEMNWDNYGSYWSIDHIIPVCKFDLTIEDEKLIKVHNRDGTKFKDIKPQIDRIAQYLIDEGFVKDLIPMVKVIMY